MIYEQNEKPFEERGKFAEGGTRLPLLEPAPHRAHARTQARKRAACLRRRRSAAAASYLLVLPTWVVLGFFFVLPLVIMLVISFGQRGTYGGLKPIEDLGAYISSGDFLANYARSLEPLYLADLLALALDGGRHHRPLPGDQLSDGLLHRGHRAARSGRTCCSAWW